MFLNFPVHGIKSLSGNDPKFGNPKTFLNHFHTENQNFHGNLVKLAQIDKKNASTKLN